MPCISDSMRAPLSIQKRYGQGILDFNELGQVVGVEFLGIHARTTEHALTSLHFETT